MKFSEEFIKLRLSVGFLGEKSNFNWWNSDFLSESGDSFLSPVFARTIGLAKYHGVKEAAALKHDEFIGVGLVYHLFRLPEMYEQHLHEEISNEKAKKLPKNKNEAIETLEGLSRGKALVDEGPVYMGTLDELSESTIQELASLYLSAFKKDKKVYPYFKELDED